MRKLFKIILLVGIFTFIGGCENNVGGATSNVPQSSVTPTSGSNIDLLGVNFVIKFNTLMDVSTLTNENITLYDSTTSDIWQLDCTVNNSTTVTCSPNSKLNAHNIYSLVLSNNIKSVSGISLIQVSYSYTTVPNSYIFNKSTPNNFTSQALLSSAAGIFLSSFGADTVNSLIYSYANGWNELYNNAPWGIVQYLTNAQADYYLGFLSPSSGVLQVYQRVSGIWQNITGDLSPAQAPTYGLSGFYNGNLLFLNNNGLYEYIGNSQWTQLSTINNSSMGDTRAYQNQIYRAGYTFNSQTNEYTVNVFKYDGANWNVYSTFNTSSNLSGFFVQIKVNKSGIYILSAANGNNLWYLPWNSQTWTNLSTKPGLTQNLLVYSFYINDQGNVFIITQESINTTSNNNVLMYDPQIGSWTKLGDIPNNPGSFISGVSVDNAGNIFFVQIVEIGGMSTVFVGTPQ